ncbi:MAG: hypothetical protein PHD70_10460 [Anaerostipes sp.]|nr:hypothetical protein [Anaerostipes sp.]
MTLIVGWLACDQRRQCSAYIASDSRISDNINCYDNSQKLFAFKNTPDILGYCGETLFTYQILTRLTNMCDAKMLLTPEMDYRERSDIILGEIKKAHSVYKLNGGSIRIYHIGRNNQRLFQANFYDWNGIVWTNIEIETDYNKSMKLFSDGSGKKEFEERFLDFKFGNNEGTSRNYFHCFCDVIKNVKDRHTGGIPQLVGLYNGTKFNGMYHGTIIDDKAYYEALEVENIYEMSNIRWYNENFEICNGNTKQRQIGAMAQPVSKRQLPDSPFSKV